MQTKCTREAVTKPQHSELVFQHKPWTAMGKSGFATASHVKGVTITASRGRIHIHSTSGTTKWLGWLDSNQQRPH